MVRIIKETIIMLLVCLVTMLVYAISLYKYVPSKKVVPEIQNYQVSEEVQDLLEDDIDTRKEDDKVVLTYEVTSSDLKNYQQTNDYVPGKINPFAEYSGEVTTDTPEGSIGDSGEQNANSKEDTNPNNTTVSREPSVYSNNSGTK